MPLERKYEVRRTRDGSTPEWPHFVLGARDPAARVAMMEYARAAERMGYDLAYVSAVRARCAEFVDFAVAAGDTDPSVRTEGGSPPPPRGPSGPRRTTMSSLPDPKVHGREYRKTATVFAVQVHEPFEVLTTEGPNVGKPGDYLVEAPNGTRYIAEQTLFEASYAPVE